MPRPPRQHKLTIALLKADMPRDAVLRDPDSVVSYVVPSLSQTPSLFVASKPPHPPRWQQYLAPHVDGDMAGLFAASSGAALLIEAGKRLFAVTFGQGRHLLNTEAFERDFGLRVVLNTVVPGQLKSVDSKTIDETTMHTRRDVSRDSTFSSFGLDVSRDLLRAVTGTPQDETLGPRLTGADSLGIHTRLQIPELRGLLSRLLEAYGDDAYKANGFEFIDFLRPEKSVERIHELEERLITDLASNEITDVHLAAPEPLDWLDVEGFRFSTQDSDVTLESDPHITSYLASRKGEELTIGLLKHDRMEAIRASDGFRQATWPILDCIVYQIEYEGQLYVLSTGDWFRVNLGFKERVYEEVRRLPLLTGLPDADPGTDEDAYNIKAAAALDALCLDKKLVYDGGPDKMEICDILTRDGGLIHVKHRGSSATLSHLFTQGVNSAERLLQDADFRSEARTVAARASSEFAEVLSLNRPSPEAHEVSFVVITRSNRDTPLTLPFFSVVSLQRAASRLRGYGFRVSVAAVREAS
ncbi:MAG: DUF6119 family protein [Gaiellaceae bacterium]